MKVIHSYEKKNLRKLRRNEEADCSKCAFAEKTPDIEGGDGADCDGYCLSDDIEDYLMEMEALKDGSTTD